ncbi:MAG: DUF6531 domain-containing protein [Pseudomonadales bacterium]|nr:DUF6531 domain-containing protein [Pseudomonadales bacterium]
MLYLAPRMGIATALLFCIFFVAPTHATTTPSQDPQAFFDAYLSGGDIDAFGSSLAQSASAWNRPARTASPVTMSLAYQQFLPRLAAALESDHTEVWQLRHQYLQLKAEHLLFLEYLAGIEDRLNQLGEPGFRQTFSTRYHALVTPLYENLDSFYQQYGNLVSSNSVVDNIASIIGNYLDAGQLDGIASELLQLLPPPHRSIIRASALPYGSLNLATRDPVYEPAITPSYHQGTAPEPTQVDLNSYPQAPLSETILQLAAELDYDPVAIFRFVHNNIEREWYAGAMKGAEGTLTQLSGNAVDQASLLIALLRASSVPARYVHGVVELPIERLQNELGLTDPLDIARVIRTSGVAAKSVIRGGRIAAMEVEHTWVSAYVPYTNYRGATVDRSGKLWLPLDPSNKSYITSAPAGVLADMESQLDALEQQYLQQLAVESPLDTIRGEVTDHLVTQGLEYAEQLGGRQIRSDALDYLPNSLTIPVIAVTSEEVELSPGRVQQIRVRVYRSTDGSGDPILDKTLPIALVASERFTLSYLPFSTEDQKFINAFGGLDAVPPYLVKLRPQLKVAGHTVAVAEAGIDMASWQRMDIDLIAPGHTKTVSKDILAGGYEAIGVSAQLVTSTEDSERVGDTEYLGARLLSQAALRYLKAWDESERELAKLAGLLPVKALPSVTFVGHNMVVDRVLNEPQRINWKGVTMDAVFRAVDAISYSEHSLAAARFHRLSALQGSFLEHQRFEDDFQVDSVSAEKVLALAFQQGIEVVDLGPGDVVRAEGLALGDNVRTSIVDWLRLGHHVKVPVAEIAYEDWLGAAWIVSHPQTGAQGYFLSGGLAGGQSASLAWPDAIRNALVNDYSDLAETDPSLAYELRKVPVSDLQQGAAGEAGEPLSIIALSEDGRPVAGVPIKFIRELGGVTFDGAASTVVVTDEQGIARAPYTHGTSTDTGAVYRMLDPGHQYAEKVSFASVSAQALSSNARLSEPFEILTTPGPLANLIYRFNTKSAEPGAWASSLRIRAVDSYGNTISNASIRVETLEPEPVLRAGSVDARVAADRTGCPMIPSVWSCGGESVGVVTGPLHGTVVYLFNGSESGITYRWRLSSGSVSKTIENKTEKYWDDTFVLTYRSYMAADGSNAQAAAPGELFPEPLYFSMYEIKKLRSTGRPGQGVQYEYEREPVDFEAPPAISVSNGGSAFGLKRLGPGEYSIRLRVGTVPAFNVLSVNSRPAGEVFSIDPRITGFGNTPVLELDGEGVSVNPLTITHEVNPAEFTDPDRHVFVFKDGLLLSDTLKEGASTAQLPSGLSVDVEKAYTAKLLIKPGSRFEIASDPVPLPVFQRTIAYPYQGDDPSQAVHHTVTREVDLMNQWICDSNAQFFFDLNHEAEVTLDLINPDTGDETALLTGETYGKGKSSTSIPISDIGEGVFEFRMHTISSLDGHEEVVNGFVEVAYRLESDLPVGHAVEENVDLFDGHLFLSRTDFSVESRGPNLEFIRYYSSNNRLASTLGPGWSHNLDSQVRDAGCGSLAISGGAGGGRYFPNGEGGFVPQKGLHGHLARATEGDGWVFTAKDGTRYYYEKFRFNDRAWQLSYIIGPNDNRLALGYDPAASEPKLMVAEDGSGRSLKFRYDSVPGVVPGSTNEVIAEITAPYGLTYLFEYDDFGRLVKAVKKGGSSVTESYGYNATSSGMGSYPRFNDINTLTSPNGHVIDYTYDLQWIRVDGMGGAAVTDVQVSSVSTVTRHQSQSGNESVKFDYSSRTDRTVDLTTDVDRGRGRQKLYTLNQYGSPLSIAGPAGSVGMTWTPDDVLMTSRTDERGVTTSYGYDDWGNVTSEKVGGMPEITRTFAVIGEAMIRNRMTKETGINGETTHYDYDGSGNLVEIKHPGGWSETYTYAGNGDRLTHTDRNGNTTSYQTYDAYGYVGKVANAEYCCDRYTWNVLGLKTSATNGRGAKTTFSYDGLGRLIEKVDAEGGKTTYTYDKQDNKLSETDPEERTTDWEYNERNLVTQINKTLGSSSIRLERNYDEFGNLVAESDWAPGGRRHWTTYKYDSANRQTLSLQEDGEGSTRRIARSYDGIGNVLEETRDLGRSERYEYDDLSRRVRVYDAFNELTRETVYNDSGKTRTDRDKLGRQVVTSFDGLGRPVSTRQSLSDGGTVVTTKRYDGNGNVLESIDPRGVKTVSEYDGLDRRITENVYDSDGTRLTSHYTDYDNAGNIVREINGRGIATMMTYDKLDRLTHREFPKGSDEVYTFGYDKVGNRTRETWPNGNVVTLTYDDLNRLETRSDKLGPLEENGYDANGNRIRQVDANGNVTTTEYDGFNQPRKIQRPEDRQETLTYDVLGNLLSRSRGGQSTFTYSYDELNRKLSETDPFGNSETYDYDKVGNLVSVTDRRNHTTTHEYNDLNQRVRTTDPNGDSLKFTYDLVGNLVEEVDKEGHTTTTDYDGLNRPVTMQRNGVRIVTNEYDEAGNLITETDALSNVTVRVYDDANRLVELSREESSLTRYRYDLMGNRIAECDPESRPSNWRYDKRGRQTYAINAAGVTTFNYDGNGNRIAETKPKGNAAAEARCSFSDSAPVAYPGDSADYTWHYEYDGADRLEAVTDGSGEVTRYTYNALDLRTSQTDALQQTTTMAYDDLGRLTSVTYPDSEQEQYTGYDENGNLTSMTDANGNQVGYVYDKLDRETQRTFVSVAPLDGDTTAIDTAYDGNNNVTTVTETLRDGSARTTTQAYDEFDRLVRREDGFGKVTRYAYDANGNRTQLIDPDQNVTRYQYDRLNRLQSVVNLNGTTGYQYDKSGLRTRVSYPFNAEMAYSYDAVGRTESVTHRQNNALVSRFEYDYDAHGNRTRQDEENGRGLETTRYVYDTLDRLTEVTYPDVPAGTGTTVIYSYDAAWNRTGETILNQQATTIGDRTYHYTNRNQIERIDDHLNPSLAIQYGFDANGNQVSKSQGGASTGFVYDARDNLRSVTTGGSTVGQFLYDYRGLRIEKQGARGTERYSYDDQSVLTQFDDTGATVAKYEYGNRRLISLTSLANGLQYYHFDALGSPVTLTKPDGSVQARYSYDAWGHVRAQSGESWNRFGFTGHEHDRETGLIYAKARYYDPDTGRFLSQDPWEGDINVAPSLNKYLYAYQNPTVYWDPDGRCSAAVDFTICQAVKAESLGIDLNTRAGVDALGEYERGQLVGGAKAVASIVTETAMLAWDFGGSALYSISGGQIAQEESHRLGKRVAGLVEFAKNPLGTVEQGLTTTVQAHQQALNAGEYGQAGKVAGEFGTNVGLSLAPPSIGVAKLSRWNRFGIDGDSGLSFESQNGQGAYTGELSVGAMQTPPEILARGDNPYGDVVNGKSLPNADATTALRRQYDELDLNDSDAWCTECAANLFSSAGGEGKIVIFSGKTENWPASYNWGISPSDVNVSLRDGQVDNYAHHSVYTDGRYIFDPFVSADPVPKSQYLKMLDTVNPNGVSWRISRPELSREISVDEVISNINLNKGGF